MTQTTWRPYPFTAHQIATAGTKADVLTRMVKRLGTVTRKQMLSQLEVADGKPLYSVMEKAGVVVVGRSVSKSGSISNLYGFKE